MTDFPRDDLIRMTQTPLEWRAADDESDGRIGTLYGYAARFNTPTLINSWEGRFTEQIAPGAFKRTLKDRGDRVKVLFNHGMDPSIGDKPLGRPERMDEDADGLYVEVPLDDTSYNRDLVASLRSGALDGMSFRFSVVREKWQESDDPKVLPVRIIQEAKLYELGPVTFPAYEATTAGVRGREAFASWRTTHPAAPAEPEVLLPADTGSNTPAPPIPSPTLVDHRTRAAQIRRVLARRIPEIKGNPS